jgi:hypothetical protein
MVYLMEHKLTFDGNMKLFYTAILQKVFYKTSERTLKMKNNFFDVNIF